MFPALRKVFLVVVQELSTATRDINLFAELEGENEAWWIMMATSKNQNNFFKIIFPVLVPKWESHPGAPFHENFSWTAALGQDKKTPSSSGKNSLDSHQILLRIWSLAAPHFYKGTSASCWFQNVNLIVIICFRWGLLMVKQWITLSFWFPLTCCC